MRDRRFLVEPADLREGKAWIRGAEHRHLAKVLRLGAGDPVVVFDGRGRGFHARLESVEPSAALAVLGEPESTDVEPRLALTVMASILHGERMESVVEKVTEIGAARIVPVIAERCVVKAPKGAWARLDRLRRIAVSAAKQSGRLVVPEVTEPLRLDEALRFQGDAGERALKVFLAAGGEAPASLVADPPPREAAVLVGPEGGWTSEEKESAAEAGWRRVGLGATTLRADTAAIVGAGLVLFLVCHPSRADPAGKSHSPSGRRGAPGGGRSGDS